MNRRLYVQLAVSTFSPISSRSSNGMRMCMCVCVCVCLCVCVCARGQNELEVCTTLAYPHISSFPTMPVYNHAHIHIPFEDSEATSTGLKVDIAMQGYRCHHHSLFNGGLQHTPFGQQC